VIARARAAGLDWMITIGTGCDDGTAALALRAEHPDCLAATVGLDPFSSHEAGAAFDDELARLADLLAGGGFVGLGEIGLDYHYDLDPRPLQQARFAQQLDLAVARDLPVVIHIRDAFDDALAVLGEHPRARGVIHSFSAGPELAERCLALGWHLGFNGMATFSNAKDVTAAACACPADRILFETDAPYLAPQPHRGRRCEPAHVVDTLGLIADARGERRDDLAAWSSRNARALFALDG
jgi:TatD DNase family protein